MMKKNVKKLTVISGLLIVVLITGFYLYKKINVKKLQTNVYVSNGRIEAVEIYIATKAPGRLKEVLVNEGQFVTKGSVLAVMDTDILEAQLQQAQAFLKQARANVTTAESQLHQRESEKNAAKATIGQAEAELGAARKRSQRSASLVKAGASSQQEVDDDRAGVKSAEAALLAARARVAASEAAIQTAQSQLLASKAGVESAQSSVDRMRTEVSDFSLKAPRDGRIQFRIAQTGEVLGAGGRVLSLLDLSDVYMTFFLPTEIAGSLAIGSEARMVLDAAREYVIPTTISYVSDEAQFTPKTVETENERDKLMFRIHARISPDLLKKYISRVKTGLPGVIYVKIGDKTEWPDDLKIKLPAGAE